MGLIKISEEMHEKVRLSSKAMHRSINAQAEHWLHVGQLMEANPQLNYQEICQLLLEQAKAQDALDKEADKQENITELSQVV